MKRELLEIEHLIRDDQRIDDHTRRVTIDDQQKFRCELVAQQANQQADELDDALADPIHDHAPAYRSSKSTSRLLSILDEIERGDG